MTPAAVLVPLQLTRLALRGKVAQLLCLRALPEAPLRGAPAMGTSKRDFDQNLIVWNTQSG